VIRAKIVIKNIEARIHLTEVWLLYDEIKKSRPAPNSGMITDVTTGKSPKFMIIALV
jgi:hypothetical protein